LKALADKIQKVGIIGNSSKVSCAREVSKAAKLIAAAGRSVYADAITAQLSGIKATALPDAEKLSRQVDLLLVFGGDGTMLRVAREIAGSRTPILGINIGGLGFLTAVPSVDMAKALKTVWAGEFSFESRVLLQVSGTFDGNRVLRTALNDIVISRGIVSRLIELDICVDGEPLTRYRCDGLIVSSPTGSTAYSLAAGGAVIFPTAKVLALTPICPHTLSNRALIVPMTSTIQARVIDAKPATVLSADGQMISQCAADDVIEIQRSRQSVRLMHLAGSSFCDTLRRKLHWRGAYL
jgi:NAD+ kinase